LASAQLLIVSPAFAQDTPPAPTDAKPADVKPADTTTPATDATPSADGQVEVHIESPKQVNLERREGATWQFVCSSPCDQKVSVSNEYRVMGDDLNESKAFMLDSSKGKVTLNVIPGYHNKQQQGLYVLIGGGVLAVGGILTILIGSDGKTPFSGDGETHLGNTNTIFIGSTLILAGIVGGILGGAWYIDNAHTRVGGDTAKAQPGSDKSPGSPGVDTKFQFSTSKREPTWNTPKTAGMPPVVSVPILNRTF
jgi:hypothetical protein